MRTCTINTILFDLGKVLIDFDHHLASRKIAPFSDKPEDYIYKLFFDSSFTGEFEEGRISPDEFYQRVRDALSLKLSYNEFVPIWNEIFTFTPDNRAVYDIACILRSRYTVAMVTNINSLHYEYLRKNFDIFGPFSSIFTSFELKARKPDHAVYKKILQDLNKTPQEVFYTDDRIELIEGARYLGINSFVFKNSRQLRHDLEGMDIALERAQSFSA